LGIPTPSRGGEKEGLDNFYSYLLLIYVPCLLSHGYFLSNISAVAA
jgi:hypothetical protein